MEDPSQLPALLTRFLSRLDHIEYNLIHSDRAEIDELRSEVRQLEARKTQSRDVGRPMAVIGHRGPGALPPAVPPGIRLPDPDAQDNEEGQSVPGPLPGTEPPAGTPSIAEATLLERIVNSSSPARVKGGFSNALVRSRTSSPQEFTIASPPPGSRPWPQSPDIAQAAQDLRPSAPPGAELIGQPAQAEAPKQSEEEPSASADALHGSGAQQPMHGKPAEQPLRTSPLPHSVKEDVMPIVWDHGVRLETLERQLRLLEITVHDQAMADQTSLEAYNKVDDKTVLLETRLRAMEEASLDRTTLLERRLTAIEGRLFLQSDDEPVKQIPSRSVSPQTTAATFDPWSGAAASQETQALRDQNNAFRQEIGELKDRLSLPQPVRNNAFSNTQH